MLRHLVFLIGVWMLNTSAYAKPPENVMRQLEQLAGIQAALDICFQSSEYKKINTNKALDFHKLYTSIDDVVQKYENKYDKTGAALFTAFHIAASKYSEQNSYKQQLISRYGRFCSEQMITDATKEIKDITSRPY